MAVVTFNKNATLEQGFTTSASSIKSAVSQTPDGGTNWEAALKQANDLQGRSGVKKHIIFLSDGNPTFRTSSYGGSCYSYSYSGWGPIIPRSRNIRPKRLARRPDTIGWVKILMVVPMARTVQEIAMTTVSTMLPPWLRLTSVAMLHSMW